MNFGKRLLVIIVLLPVAGLKAQKVSDPQDFFVSVTGGISSMGGSAKHRYNIQYLEYEGSAQYCHASPLVSRIEGLVPLSSWFSDYIAIGLHFEDIDALVPFAYGSLLTPEPGDTAIRIIDSHILLQYLGMSVGIKYDLSSPRPGGCGVQLSLCGGVKLKSQQHSTFQLMYAGGEFKREKVEQLDNARWYRLSLRPEFLYDIPLGARFVVTPRVGSDFSLTEIEPTRINNVSFLFAAISLAYAIH